ncbi:hypothetical protein PR048_020838 [Dryococelus australis]|uniref:Uncharacterized protein n=1 Tax=Dryococelus australis TaxID=614101 RepID=A0ABQ9GWI2_9NEOP|nr:hypothetical protein PR048_020838 [Dryococelus australis]
MMLGKVHHCPLVPHAKKIDNWKKAVNIFDHHSKTQYHLSCVHDADELLSRSAGQSIEFYNCMGTEMQEKFILTQRFPEKRAIFVRLFDTDLGDTNLK